MVDNSIYNQGYSDVPISRFVTSGTNPMVSFNGFAWDKQSGMVSDSNNITVLSGAPDVWFTGTTNSYYNA